MNISIPFVLAVCLMAPNTPPSQSAGGAALRSALLPGWGQYYNHQPAKAWLLAGALAGSLAAVTSFQLMGDLQLNRFERDQLIRDRNKADANFNHRNLALYIAAGLWLLGVIDAYINGDQPAPDHPRPFY